MPRPLALLGLAGSLRRGSYNCAALVAAQGLGPSGATLALFDRASIPPFNPGGRRLTGGRRGGAEAAHPRCRRGADRRPRVQLLDPGVLNTAPALAQ